jgi:EmrB/QacA subfamily drug resistance transporter
VRRCTTFAIRVSKAIVPAVFAVAGPMSAIVAAAMTITAHITVTYAMIIYMAGIIDAARSDKSRWIALVVVCLGQLMSIVDATIVNVALPRIQHDLHFSQANLTWVLNGYLISYGSFLLLAGRLGDLIGRRRIFLGGVSLFTIASAACGFADSQGMLIVARFIQGLGGAGATSAIVAIIATEFPAAGERAKAMSVYTFVVSGGASLGLIAGGVITQSIDWHWIFFINVPVGIFTVLMGRARIVENPGLGIGRDLDVLGSVLVTAALVLGAYAIVTSTRYGWGSAHTIAFAAASIVLLAAFVALEARLRNPIMPLRIFRVPGLGASSVIRGLLITGMYASFFVGVLYLQHIRGYGVLQTGLAFLAQTVVLALLSLGVTARLVIRFGARTPLLIGLVSGAAGLYVLGHAGPGSPYFPDIAVAFVLIGIGAGLAFMPLLTIGMAHVPAADAGLASGIINTSMQMSAAIGVAVLGTVATSRTQTLAGRGDGHVAALLGGYHLAFRVATASVVAAVIAALLLLRDPRSPEQATVADGAAAETMVEVEAA